MLVIVASQNPVKIKAVKAVFKKAFGQVKIKSVSVSSGVSCQPMSFKEAYLGALNRAKKALEKFEKADFAVGIEGGVEKYCFGWTTGGVVVIINKKREKGVAISSQLELPFKVIKEIRKGKELGVVMEEISGEKNIKQREGAFGYFTNNLVTRQQAYFQAVAFALARFFKEDFL